MNVLISEDDEYKFRKIEKSVRKTIPDSTISREISVRGTLKHIKNNHVDVLIQDMNLPVWEDGSDIRSGAGMDVVYTVGVKNSPIKFRFVCSSDGSFKDDYEEDLDRFGFKFVHFEASKCLDNSFNIK